jgi:hypothetical protein
MSRPFTLKSVFTKSTSAHILQVAARSLPTFNKQTFTPFMADTCHDPTIDYARLRTRATLRTVASLLDIFRFILGQMPQIWRGLPGRAVPRSRRRRTCPPDGGAMLSDASHAAALPCSDVERAKSFYADKLGLVPVGEMPDRIFRPPDTTCSRARWPNGLHRFSR